MAQRSGKADAYLVKGTLQSLVNDKTGFESLSPAGQAAVKRTLAHNGQVIIPNVYGYPLAGYAFIPNTPYDANYEHRPNQGLMIDLRKGSAHEIQGMKALPTGLPPIGMICSNVLMPVTDKGVKMPIGQRQVKCLIA